MISNSNIGILKQMKETFESNLDNSQKDETANSRAYEDLKAAKEAEIQAGQEQFNIKEEDRARAAVCRAAAAVHARAAVCRAAAAVHLQSCSTFTCSTFTAAAAVHGLRYYYPCPFPTKFYTFHTVPMYCICVYIYI